jgi:hypothetical protein
MPTRFFELAGDDARPALDELAGRARALGASARLLASVDTDGLYLLVVEGDPMPAMPAPDGCRVWTFREAAR